MMSTSTTCDYCGEPIDEGDRYKVELFGTGVIEGAGGLSSPKPVNAMSAIGHYHASDERCCWLLMMDKLFGIQQVSNEFGGAMEERVWWQAKRAQWQEGNRLRDEERQATRHRIAAALEAWEALGQKGQQEQLLGVFVSDDWLLGREVAARLNSQWTLEPGDQPLTAQGLRGFVRRMVAAGLLEETRERDAGGRFMYRRLTGGVVA